MFSECEHCGKTIKVEINFDENRGMVILCQCQDAFEAHVQEQRVKFERSKKAVSSARSRKEPIKPRKLSRHR